MYTVCIIPIFVIGLFAVYMEVRDSSKSFLANIDSSINSIRGSIGSMSDVALSSAGLNRERVSLFFQNMQGTFQQHSNKSIRFLSHCSIYTHHAHKRPHTNARPPSSIIHLQAKANRRR